jgi:hypothetical protein
MDRKDLARSQLHAASMIGNGDIYRFLQTYRMYPDVDGEDRQIPLLELQIHGALTVVRELLECKLSSIKGTGLRCTWL